MRDPHIVHRCRKITRSVTENAHRSPGFCLYPFSIAGGRGIENAAADIQRFGEIPLQTLVIEAVALAPTQ